MEPHLPHRHDSSTSRWSADPIGWLDSLDRHAKVGAKHHIIPRFLLKRWANDASRVQAKLSNRSAHHEAAGGGVERDRRDVVAGHPTPYKRFECRVRRSVLQRFGLSTSKVLAQADLS